MTSILPPTLARQTGPEIEQGTPRGLTSDYTTFLRMLTVQMQNQDPLNPMEASDFAVQLATFSNVEQATRTNDLLSALLARGDLSDMGRWVGMEARVTDGAWFGGDPIVLAPEPVEGATSVTLIVRDASGTIIDSRTLPAEAAEYRWDGTLTSGDSADEGTYRFEIESRRGDEVLGTTPVAAYLRVQEARIEDGTTYLVVGGGMMVDSRSVTGLRQPQDSGSTGTASPSRVGLLY